MVFFVALCGFLFFFFGVLVVVVHFGWSWFFGRVCVLIWFLFISYVVGFDWEFLSWGGRIFFILCFFMFVVLLCCFDCVFF